MPEPTSDLTDDLQFDVVDPAVAAPKQQRPACAGCGRPIAGTYYALGDRLVCPNCRTQVDAPPAGSAFGRLLKATGLGIGAGLLGAAVWFAIRRGTGYQIGLVAVLVGVMVGKAVRNGSGNRGGRGYQVLAVLLAYGCVAANYMPDVYQGLMAARDKAIAAEHRDGSTTPPAKTSTLPLPVKMAIRLTISFAVSLALPVLMAKENPIGLLIIGFALWEAWKINARRRLPITGPYQFGEPGGPAVVGVMR